MNVGMIVWSGDRILLVKQESGTASGYGWTLPGGGVDAGETVLEAAARETLEETGIVVSACGRLVYVMEYAMSRERSPGGHSLVFEVTEWSGEPHVSEEGILEARFVPVSEAIVLLEQHLPIPRMRDPVLAFLRGEAEYGTYWIYGRDENGNEQVTARTRESVRKNLSK
jgi:8-oxo-dGTP pyrophosphatase MutT (NUDIX family)